MSDVRVRFPPGHFYSPIVDPAEIGDYVSKARSECERGLPGISVDPERMGAFWNDNLDFIRSMPLAAEPDGSRRYHYRNTSFGLGDAIVLAAMIHAHRPRRIIEIGSGFSTACMLDAADAAGLRDLEITCIEPYPDRLRALLRPGDEARTTVLEQKVQGIPIETFRQLHHGDILFIDSTHVLKTASDVHYELFSILPSLDPGVIVHFHDMQYPFEYPDDWLLNENFSWNEIYAVRAFLMYNPEFHILFFNSLFGRLFPRLVGEAFPCLAPHPTTFGGSLWIRRSHAGRRSAAHQAEPDGA